jgi:hypothetical protein
MTPLEAIRKFCVDCVGGSPHGVTSCGGDRALNGGCDRNGMCWFYRYRLGKGRPSVKTIRNMCLWCQGEQEPLVRECQRDPCALWTYRMGKNPARKGQCGGSALFRKRFCAEESSPKSNATSKTVFGVRS